MRPSTGALGAFEYLSWAFSTRPAVPVYWRWTPTVVVPFFRSPGLVDDQHRLEVAQVFGDIVADVITDRVVVPHRSAKQVLHPVRAGVAGVLSDRPAVLAWRVGQ